MAADIFIAKQVA